MTRRFPLTVAVVGVFAASVTLSVALYLPALPIVLVVGIIALVFIAGDAL